MTELQCPYCGTARSTSKAITPQTKVRCPTCKNVFRPLPKTGPSDPDPMAVPLELELDEPIAPPPRSAPLTRPALQPEKELYGYRPMPIMSARKFMAIALGIGVLGLVALFATWYMHQVRTLDKMADKAASRHIAKVNRLVAPVVSKADLKPAMPTIPVVQQNPVSPQLTPLPMQAVPSRIGLMAQQPIQQQFSNAGMAPVLQPQIQLPAPVPANDKVVDPAIEKKAASKVYMAKKLEKEGKVRLASKLYQEVIDQYADTKAAEEAQKRIGYSLDKQVEKAEKLYSLAQGFEPHELHPRSNLEL